MSKSRREQRRERMRQMKQQQAAKSSGSGHLLPPPGKSIDLLEIKDGNMLLDIVGYEVTSESHPTGIPAGEIWWELTYKLHFGVGADNRTVVCPTTFGQKCPICQQRKKLMKDYDANKKAIDAMRPQTRMLMNVLHDGEIKLIDYSKANFGSVLLDELNLSADEEYDLFWEFEKGYTVKARFKKDSFEGRSFIKCDRIDFKKREDFDEEQMLEEVFPLDDLLAVPTYEQLEKWFFEMDDVPAVESSDEEQESEEEEEQPKRKNRFTKKKKPEPEEEEEELEEEEPEPEEEEEELEEVKPKKRGRRERKSKKEDEPEDVDDKCPYGHRYAHDFEEEKECADCELWADCGNAKDALEGK
jgi:hypothetical protein